MNYSRNSTMYSLDKINAMCVLRYVMKRSKVKVMHRCTNALNVYA